MPEMLAGRSNDAWVEALRQRDPLCLADLRQYLCHCLDKVLAGRAGQSDAEDFAQQALTRVLEVLGTFRGDSRFTTWASAIAIRIAFTELRRKRWGEVPLDVLMASVGHAFAPAANLAGAGAATAKSELLDALRDSIANELTERQRTFVLAELAGMPSVVLAGQLGMTAGAGYKLYHDARKKLRGSLQEKGFCVDDVRFALEGASNTK